MAALRADLGVPAFFFVGAVTWAVSRAFGLLASAAITLSAASTAP